jgi:RHS repeat-associated protein
MLPYLLTLLCFLVAGGVPARAEEAPHTTWSISVFSLQKRVIETPTLRLESCRLESCVFTAAKNQLVRARTKNHDTAAQGYDLTFSYDSEGRRFSKHVIQYRNGAQVSEKEITYIWDGWNLIYERHQLPSGLTTLERRYLWGPDLAGGIHGDDGAGGLLVIRETRGSAATDIYPLYDGTGHVTALTNANQDLLATYACGPFGEQIKATSPLAHSNPWRYATKYRDEETGLYYFGRRYYDPVTGQWTSRELLGEDESLNLYSYCHNDPVNGVDRLGLETVEAYQKSVSEANGALAVARIDHWNSTCDLDASLAKWGCLVAAAKAKGATVDPALIQAIIWLDASARETNDMLLANKEHIASLTSDIAAAGINRLYRQATFLEWAGDHAPGTLDPNSAPDYFDDDNPEFRSDEWTRFWIQVNPSNEITRQTLLGSYGQAGKEFGKEVFIWSAFCIGGELLATGRVAIGTGTRGRGLIGLVKAGGTIDETLGTAYLNLAQSPQFAANMARYNRVAGWLGQKQISSVDDIVAALRTDTTFARTSNLRAGMFPPKQHLSSKPFWLQGNPLSAYGRRAGRHELLHMGAALRGQGDTVLHELAVCAGATPGNLVVVGAGTGYSLYSLNALYQALFGQP